MDASTAADVSSCRRRWVWFAFLLLAFTLMVETPHALATAGLGGTAAEAAASATRRTTYEEMLKQFNSVTCRGETLDQCTSAPSEALKSWIRQMVDEGKTKDQIIKAVVAEFGEKILAVSPRRGLVWWLWILPAVGVAVGVALTVRFLRSRAPDSGRRDEIRSVDLDPHYQEEIEREVRRGL